MHSTTQRPPVPPALALTVGVFAISISAILIRVAQGELPSIAIAAWRLTFAALLLSVPALTKHREELRNIPRQQWPLALLSGVMLAIHFATWIASLAFTTVAASGVLVATSPLWVALAAPFFLGERLTRLLGIGIFLALIGAVLVALSDASGGGGSNPLWGNFLALVGAVSAAAYFIIGRKLRASQSIITYTFVVYGVAAVVLVLMALFGRIPLLGYSPSGYLLCLLMALFPQLLGHSSINYALGYLPASLISVTVLSEPIGATILALLILGETPTALTILGGLLILVGIFISAQTGDS